MWVPRPGRTARSPSHGPCRAMRIHHMIHAMVANQKMDSKKARIRYSADFKEYKKKGENSSLVKPAFFFQHYLDEAGLNVQKSKASLTFLERLNNIFYRFVTFLNIDSLVNVSHIDEEHLLFTKPQELNIMLKFIQGQPEQDFFIEKYTKLLELNNKIRDDFAT